MIWTSLIVLKSEQTSTCIHNRILPAANSACMWIESNNLGQRDHPLWCRRNEGTFPVSERQWSEWLHGVKEE